jgi:UrcA family protein
MNTQSILCDPFGGRDTAAGAAILMALFGIVPVSVIADQRAATTSDSRVADVSLADLDLSTLEGSHPAYERLETMARRLCSELARSSELAYQPNYGACVHNTLVGALAQANVLAATRNTCTARRTGP